MSDLSVATVAVVMERLLAAGLDAHKHAELVAGVIEKNMKKLASVSEEERVAFLVSLLANVLKNKEKPRPEKPAVLQQSRAEINRNRKLKAYADNVVEYPVPSGFLKMNTSQIAYELEENIPPCPPGQYDISVQGKPFRVEEVACDAAMLPAPPPLADVCPISADSFIAAVVGPAMCENDVLNAKIFLSEHNVALLAGICGALPAHAFCIVDGMNFIYNFEIMHSMFLSFREALPWTQEEVALLASPSRPEYLNVMKKFESDGRINLLFKVMGWLAARLPSMNLVVLYRGKYDAILQRGQLLFLSSKEFIGGRAVNKLEADDLIAVFMYHMLTQSGRSALIFSRDRFSWIKDEAYRLGLCRGDVFDLFTTLPGFQAHVAPPAPALAAGLEALVQQLAAVQGEGVQQLPAAHE